MLTITYKEDATIARKSAPNVLFIVGCGGILQGKLM
jgi:hypothetical protein